MKILLICLVLLIGQLRAIAIIIVIRIVAIVIISLVLGLLFIIVVSWSICIVATVVFFGCALASILNNPQLLCYIHHFELFQLERAPILHSNIFTFDDAAEVVD